MKIVLTPEACCEFVWLRSANSNNTNNFYNVNNDGSNSIHSASNDGGVAPDFCLKTEHVK